MFENKWINFGAFMFATITITFGINWYINRKTTPVVKKLNRFAAFLVIQGILIWGLLFNLPVEPNTFLQEPKEIKSFTEIEDYLKDQHKFSVEVKEYLSETGWIFSFTLMILGATFLTGYEFTKEIQQEFKVLQKSDEEDTPKKPVLNLNDD